MKRLRGKREVEPFDPKKHKPVQTAGQSYATEYLASEEVPEGKGKFFNIPTIWFDKETKEPLLFGKDRAINEAILYENRTGKKFPRYSSQEKAEEAAKKRSQKGGASKETLGKAEGGAVMQEQMNMAFMQEGGMQDDGGETEPKSGNKVPSGSLKEEVADDIPTMLSEGEFVFPADVVRYIGLETLMKMRQDAKQGLKMMEKMGQLGNPEEAEIPDDVPFGMADLVVISGEMKKEDDKKEEKAEGGVVGLQTGGLLDDPRFTSQVTTGTQPTEYTEEEKQEIRDSLKTAPTRGTVTLKKIVNPNNPDDFEMHPFEGDEPMFPLPEGYVVDESSTEEQLDPTRATSSSMPSSEERSKRERDEGVTTTTPIEVPQSTEDLAREVPQARGKPYVLNDEEGNPIKLQRSIYENLIREYEQLGGDATFNSFAEYYNVPFRDKVALNVAYDLNTIVPGVKYSKKETDNLLKDFREGKIKVGNPLYRVLSKAFSTVAKSSSVAPKAPQLKGEAKKIATAEKELEKLTGLPPTPTQATETPVTEADLDKYYKNIETASQAPLGVTPVDRTLLGIRGTTKDPMIRSTFRDPNDQFKTVQKDVPLTKEALGRIEEQRQKATDVKRLGEEARQRAERGKRDPLQEAEERVGRQREQEEQRQEIAGPSGFDLMYGSKGGLPTRMYVGGVPTKPMKPQRLKKGGIASPKAKPKKMKKGGLASSRKK